MKVALRALIAGDDPEVAPMARFDLGNLLRDEGDVAGATAAFQAAIESNHPETARI